MMGGVSAGRPAARDRGRLLASGAAIIVVVDLVGYIAWLRAQGSDDGSNRVYFIVAFLLVLALICAWAAIDTSPRRRPALFAFAVIGLLLTGVLGLFSIGLPLLLACGLMIAGALAPGRPPIRRAPVVGAAALLAAAALFTGMYATDLPARCPTQARNSSGGGTSLFHGSYTFTCVNRQLTLHAG
jgi:hypothetical protein